MTSSLQATALKPRDFEVQNWGRIAYEEAWKRQKELVEARVAREIPDTLVFCEHNPVVTLGRVSQREAKIAPLILPKGVPVLEIERGGQATYHGPGQIVAYPIFQLGKNQEAPAKRGVHALIRSLEDWVIDYLKNDFGLSAGRVEGQTGIWIEGSRKIGSIGIAARHWVSYHGLSLNLCTGKEVWQGFNPCGFSSSVMTDLQIESGQEISIQAAQSRLAELAVKHFS